MAKKSSLSKALDKRKKKVAKKSIKQATPQSESYSIKRDKKEKAKPAGYRFKGLDNFGTPTKKQIAADAKKPRAKRKTYFENRKDKSDKSPSQYFAKGGKIKPPKYKVGDKVYSYENPTVKREIAFVFPSDDPTYSHRYKLTLYHDDGHSYSSKYISEGSLYKRKQKKYESGGITDINAHSGDSAITVQNEMFGKGGYTLSAKNWHGVGTSPEESLSKHKFVARKQYDGYDRWQVLYREGRYYDSTYIHEGYLDKLIKGEEFASDSEIDKFLGKNKTTKEKWLESNMINKLKTTVDFWGFESILGDSFDPFSKKEALKMLGESKYALGGSINAHSGDSAIAIQNEMFSSGGKLAHDSKRTKSLEEIERNLPPNMHSVDKEQYLKTYKRIIEIESTGYNKHELEYLKNYAFRIIAPYVLDPNYKGLPAGKSDSKFDNGGSVLPEDGTQADVMEHGGEIPNGTLYWKGDLAEYTGKTETIHGGLFYEIKLLEGHLKGEHKWTQRAPLENPKVEIEPEVAVEPEIEVKLETTQKATIPNVEAAAYAENLIEFMGTNVEGKLLPNGDYVVLSFLFYPIWFYCAKDQKWYGNSDKYNSVTAMHISQSRPTPNAEMLSCAQLFERMNQGIQTYDLGGVLVRQLYPMSFDNAIAHQ